MSQEADSILDKIISTQQVSHREQFKPNTVLRQLLELLNERERQVVMRRFGLEGRPPETLESIGLSLKVTRERIRQIQRLAVQKLSTGRRAHELLEPVRQVVVEVLESEGGAVAEERLVQLLTEAGEQTHVNVVLFYLSEILIEVVSPIGLEDENLQLGWRLRNANLEAVMRLTDQAREVISARGTPLHEDELVRTLLAQELTSPLGGRLTESNIVIGLLSLSKLVKRNTFGEWGLAHWETVTPKRMNDKIYLVLKKHGKPLHFRDITRLINEAKFDHKVAYPPTVHNELIMDKKYVLVGRGIYALKEWGYRPGVVADLLIDALKEHAQPMTRDELVAAVMKQRLVRRGTIHLALTNRQRFERLPDGRYTLAAA